MKRRNQKGAVAVEFALVLPVLLILVFGIIEFSLVLYDQAIMTNASREAARAGVVLSSPKPTVAQIQTVATNYLSNYLVTFGSSTTPTVTVPNGAGGSFGTPLTVNIAYTFTGLSFVSMISPLTGSLALNATTTMNNE
ncbi:TadE/TadG family type IV pilus assembly protein [Trinickia terrae]|nr:TadE/TadG family type IV pilus assembly protein [Trinickia terrae]